MHVSVIRVEFKHDFLINYIPNRYTIIGGSDS